MIFLILPSTVAFPSPPFHTHEPFVSRLHLQPSFGPDTFFFHGPFLLSFSWVSHVEGPHTYSHSIVHNTPPPDILLLLTFHLWARLFLHVHERQLLCRYRLTRTGFHYPISSVCLSDLISDLLFCLLFTSSCCVDHIVYLGLQTLSSIAVLLKSTLEHLRNSFRWLDFGIVTLSGAK